jgi:hypothetical protein
LLINKFWIEAFMLHYSIVFGLELRCLSKIQLDKAINQLYGLRVLGLELRCLCNIQLDKAINQQYGLTLKGLNVRGVTKLDLGSVT